MAPKITGPGFWSGDVAVDAPDGSKVVCIVEVFKMVRLVKIFATAFRPDSAELVAYRESCAPFPLLSLHPDPIAHIGEQAMQLWAQEVGHALAAPAIVPPGGEPPAPVVPSN